MSWPTPEERIEKEMVYRRRLQIENATTVQLAIERACRESLASHDKLCDNQKPDACPLPPGTLTPAIAQAALERRLAELSDRSPSPVTVYCELGPEVGSINYRFHGEIDRAVAHSIRADR
jgi:hypothetical protein